MTTTGKAKAIEQLRDLVAKHRAERGRPNEEATKQGLILPLFRALGWDTENTSEVAPEVKAGAGRVDYAFRIGGIARFYLEAKPLAEPLDNHVKQAVSYAYNKGIPYAVLTNFRDLWAFAADVVEPPRGFLTLSADTFLANLDDLWLLSKESVASDALQNAAINRGASPPRIQIEERLLKQFREWREQLFKELRQYHAGAFPLPLLDEVIQRLLSRLLFIRTAEDRHIQDRVLLTLLHSYQNHTLRGPLLAALRRVFQECDAVYDSELFQYHPVLDHAARIDDTTLADILSKLYQIPGGYSEYDFSAIDADVLGRVYEQYLGFVAQEARRVREEIQRRMNMGRPEEQALAEAIEVVAKPERRKAQGIYYTPKWVVDYIVRQTVGKFIEEHENRPDAIHEMRVLDPACGSGSFLIRAYSELLAWHATSSGRTEDKLFSDERLAILRNNVFGVDLDPQAVEVARLSLLLRALREQQKLPTLGDNIKRGNSLIDGGEAELKPFFGDAWQDKHPFAWPHEFPPDGLFDVVIGNPPYFNVDILGKSSPDQAWLTQHFPEVWMDKSDILFYFIARAIQQLRGRVAFIVSRSFLEADKAQKLRQFILDTCTIETIIDFQNLRVFQDPAIACAILVLRREPRSEKRAAAEIQIAKVHTAKAEGATLIKAIEEGFAGTLSSTADFSVFEYEQRSLSSSTWAFQPPTIGALYSRIDETHPKLGQVCFVGEGMQTGANDVFEVSSNTVRQANLEEAWLRKRAHNGHILRYRISPTDTWLIWTENAEDISDCPINISAWLTAHISKLKGRAAYIRGNCQWFKFTWPLHKEWYSKPKILSPYRAPSNRFALDTAAEYIGLTDTTVIFKRDHDEHDLRYYLGLLNSRVLTFRYRGIGKLTGGGIYEYFENGISHLPIRRLDLAKPEEKAQHDRIVALVEEMLALQQRRHPAAPLTAADQEELDRRIAQQDRALDDAVYDLYGLTADERRIVEEAVPAPVAGASTPRRDARRLPSSGAKGAP